MGSMRPEPTLTTKRGSPAYFGPELAAYRRMKGITQETVALHIGLSRLAVAMTEGRFRISKANGDRYVKAVDYMAMRRDNLVRRGERDWELIQKARAEARLAEVISTLGSAEDEA
jgi:DNA-binding XRE family transcriptional regulator